MKTTFGVREGEAGKKHNGGWLQIEVVSYLIHQRRLVAGICCTLKSKQPVHAEHWCSLGVGREVHPKKPVTRMYKHVKNDRRNGRVNAGKRREAGNRGKGGKTKKYVGWKLAPKGLPAESYTKVASLGGSVALNRRMRKKMRWSTMALIPNHKKNSSQGNSLNLRQ